MIICLLLLSIFLLPVQAEETAVRYGQSEAREMLEMVNELRSSENWQLDAQGNKVTVDGLEPLFYDYELESLAMQRAAEISLSFSHTRPNGERASAEMYAEGYSAAGENIAWGYASKETVMEAWKEEDAGYSGQGHRRNMLNRNYNVMAVGHAVIGGRHYWVQLFGYRDDPITAETEACDQTITYDILSGRPFSVSLNTDVVSLAVGKKTTLLATVSDSDKAPVWSSSDKNTATVDSKGQVTAKAVGTAVVTATVTDGSSASASCTVTVTPSVPKLTAIYNSAKGADIRFKEVSGADAYVIMQKYQGVWSAVTTVSADSLSTENGSLKYIDSSVAANYGKGYIYSVAAMQEGIVSAYSTRGLPLYRLKQPTITSVTGKDSRTVEVKWTKENCHGYEVQYSSDNGKTWTKAPQVKDGTVTVQTIEVLQSGVTYVFRIRCQKTNKDRGTTWSQYSPWKKCLIP